MYFTKSEIYEMKRKVFLRHVDLTCSEKGHSIILFRINFKIFSYTILGETQTFTDLCIYNKEETDHNKHGLIGNGMKNRVRNVLCE